MGLLRQRLPPATTASISTLEQTHKLKENKMSASKKRKVEQNGDHGKELKQALEQWGYKLKEQKELHRQKAFSYETQIAEKSAKIKSLLADVEEKNQLIKDWGNELNIKDDLISAKDEKERVLVKATSEEIQKLKETLRKKDEELKALKEENQKLELANPQEAQETLRKKEEELKAAKDEIDDLKWKLKMSKFKNEDLEKALEKAGLDDEGFPLGATLHPCCEHIDEREKTLEEPATSGSGAAYCQEEEGRDFLGRHTGKPCTCMSPCTYETVYDDANNSGMVYLCPSCDLRQDGPLNVIRGNEYKILCEECLQKRDRAARRAKGEDVTSSEEESDEESEEESEAHDSGNPQC